MPQQEKDNNDAVVMEDFSLCPVCKTKGEYRHDPGRFDDKMIIEYECENDHYFTAWFAYENTTINKED